MALFVANNGQLQTIKGIYYGMTEYYINATLFHNLVPKTATEIRFLYASDNPDLIDYQRIGYADNNNFIEVWNNGTKYILINPRKNYIYAPVNCNSFLNGYTSLITCIFDNFDTSNTTNMRDMLLGCKGLASLDLSKFNTENVTSIRGMFDRCEKLESIDLSSFNTKNVTDMSYMLDSCINLKTVDLSSFNTKNVTNMYRMFNGCRKLTSIISNTFNTIALKNSNLMFYDCTSLVGGNGTTYNSSLIIAEYARVDGEDRLPGYFTAPN